MSRRRKIFCDKVEELKVEMFVTTKRFMLRQFLEAEKYEKLVATKLYVATQDTPVATRTRLHIKTMSRHCQSLSKQNPRKSSENLSRKKL